MTTAAFIGFNDFVFDGIYTITAPNADVTDLQSVKTRQLSDSAYFSALGTQTRIELASTSGLTIDSFALLGLSTSVYPNIIVQVKMYSDNGGTVQIYDSGAKTLSLTVASAINTAPERYASAIFVLPTPLAPKVIKVYFTGHASFHTQLNIGRMWASAGVRFEEGFNAAWSMSYQDFGKLDSSEDQQFYMERGVKLKILSVSFDTMNSMQAYGIDEDGNGFSGYLPTLYPNMNTCLRIVGNTDTVLVVPRCDNFVWAQVCGIYGHFLGEIPKIDHSTATFYGFSANVIEER